MSRSSELFKTISEILPATVADLETALRHFEQDETEKGIGWVEHIHDQLKEGAILLGLEADGIETRSLTD